MTEESNTFKSRYRIMGEASLVIECHEGLLTLDGMIRFRKEQGMDRDFSPCFNILMDMRKVRISGSLIEVNDYVSFYKQNQEITGSRHIAVLTDTPNQVFYITLFEQFSNMLSQKTKIFSTIEASLDWLNVDFPRHRVNAIITELRMALQEDK